MACLFLHNCVAYTLLFLLATIVRCQTTTTLPGPPSYPDGIFTSPNTVETQILDKGMEMNVTWETTYANVNLYLIFGQGYANPRGLKSIVSLHFITLCEILMIGSQYHRHLLSLDS
jgi:hypothetical protein